MVGKTSIKRTGVQTSGIDALLAKARLGARRKVVPFQSMIGTEGVLKTGARHTAYEGKAQLQIRRMGRSGPTETSSRAKALKACKGKRGCDFASCVEDALGKVPISLQKACPSKYPGAPARVTPIRRKVTA